MKIMTAGKGEMTEAQGTFWDDGNIQNLYYIYDSSSCTFVIVHFIFTYMNYTLVGSIK